MNGSFAVWVNSEVRKAHGVAVGPHRNAVGFLYDEITSREHEQEELESMMKPVDNEILLNQLQWRYATKKFDATKKISPQDWKTLEQVLIATPSSYGLQPWHFVVVTSPAVKQQLLPASYGQTQVVEASHVVVFAVKKQVDADHVQKHIDRISEVRGVPSEKLDGYKAMMVGTVSKQQPHENQAWSAKQLYIALGNLLTSAALLGIDACPMEGIVPAKFDEILGLEKQGLKTMFIATLGYRAADDHTAKAPKVRFKAEELVTYVD
jgi:nitroreductase